MAIISFLLPRSLNYLSLIDMQLTRQIFFEDVFYWFWEELDYNEPNALIEDIKLALPLSDVIWAESLSKPILQLATKVRWIHVNQSLDCSVAVPEKIRVTVQGNLDSSQDYLNSIFTSNVLNLYSQIQSDHLKEFIRLFN